MIQKRILKFRGLYSEGEISYGEILQSIESWLAYARHANSYNVRKGLMRGFNSVIKPSL